MTGPDIWVSVTCTDRASSLRALAMDLVEQASAAGVRICLLVHDNSRLVAEREAIRDLVVALAAAGAVVEVDASPCPGASIAASRRRQQEQIRARLSCHARPALVWMLDDDVRLTHLQWANDHVEERPLHCHLAFLLELGRQQPDLDVLIGDVCGDAPIPVVGSLVSRLADLEASLRAMLGGRPDDAWRAPAVSRERLGDSDAYYDLSVDRADGAWEREVVWLPREGRLTTHQALVEMLAETHHIPRGAAFSRPILADPERFAQLTPRPLRGANAVFFDVDACVQHEYPSATVGGVETRRSDMIGTRLLAAAGSTVRGSGFSVLHHRPRDAPWPTSEALVDTLVADTAGAWLARQLDPDVAPGAADAFLVARLQRLESATRALGGICTRLRSIVERAPLWAPSLEPVMNVVEWTLASYPGARVGAVPGSVVELLRSSAANGDIEAAARRAAGRSAA